MNMGEHGRLLHNMSAPPKSVVKYAGLTGYAPVLRRGRPDVSWPSFEAVGVFGTPVRFVLPACLAENSPARILQHLGVAAQPDPERQLAALLDARANELPLPDGCAVIPSTAEQRVLWPDALSALAILAKCSSSVWLRAKRPAFNAALARREATLLVPPLFAQRLPKAEP